ncbi:MAG: AIR synthase family protein [Thermomicrobiales bacterium]
MNNSLAEPSDEEERRDGTTLLGAGKLPPRLLRRLIDRYVALDASVLVGPGVGRDAAAIALDETTLVVKADPITFATERAPFYLVNVNANDLACLGAMPRWLTVTALLPTGKISEESVEMQFRELAEACDQFGVSLIGGHTEVTGAVNQPILVGQMLGTVDRDRLLKPGGSRPGDKLLLTKALAIEGTALLSRELADVLTIALGPELVAKAKNLLRDPGISVLRDAQLMLSVEGVTALHDPTEGGLAVGVKELVAASGCGAQISFDRVPVLPETTAIAAYLGIDPAGMLASGSLLASVSREAAPAVIDACQDAGIAVTPIGIVCEQTDGLTWFRDGKEGPIQTFETDEVARALLSRSS